MLEVQDLVDAQPYESKEAAVQDALRHLLRNRPDLRIKVAIYRVQKEELSLARAAALAGVSWAQMRDILLEQGIDTGLDCVTVEEA